MKVFELNRALTAEDACTVEAFTRGRPLAVREGIAVVQFYDQILAWFKYEPVRHHIKIVCQERHKPNRTERGNHFSQFHNSFHPPRIRLALRNRQTNWGSQLWQAAAGR